MEIHMKYLQISMPLKFELNQGLKVHKPGVVYTL